MIPSNSLALLAFLVGIAPGYVYQRVVERRVSRHDRSALLELVDLLCIGAVCTLLGATAILGLATAMPGLFVPLQELVAPGHAVFSTSPWRVASGVLATLALAIVFATISGLLVVRSTASSSIFVPGTAWARTFSRYLGDRTGLPSGSGEHSLYITAQMTDGRLVGGQLAFSDLAEDPQKRDLALARPLWVSNASGTERTPLRHDFAILPHRDIAIVWGVRVTASAVSSDAHAFPAEPAATGAYGKEE